jgi:hypothetical protein
MKLFNTKDPDAVDPKELKRQRKEERDVKRADKKKQRLRHRLAMATLLYKDRTYSCKEIDIDETELVRFGKDESTYNVPPIPYNLVKWWPFKSRTFKRWFMPDQHYIIIWNEGEYNAMDISWAHANATHKNIMPSSWGGLIKETLFAQSVNSMKAKNKLHLERKWLVLIVIAIVAVVVVVVLGTGVLG